MQKHFVTFETEKKSFLDIYYNNLLFFFQKEKYSFKF